MFREVEKKNVKVLYISICIFLQMRKMRGNPPDAHRYVKGAHLAIFLLELDEIFYIG